jgi:hypothetical protein
MPFPPDLKPIHVRKAVAYIEREAREFVDLYIEQPNVFSAIVGILGTKALDAVSPYEKNPPQASGSEPVPRPASARSQDATSSAGQPRVEG